MCSESSGSHDRGRCLFCSLGCALALTYHAPGTRRVAAADGGGLCARGHILADLLQSPDRLRRGSLIGGPVRPADALGLIRTRVSSPKARTVVWLDGNAALEDLDAARRFCERQEGRRLFVHLPPAERGVVEGLDDAGAMQCPPHRWPEADALLVVGNPLATHPASARLLLCPSSNHARRPVIVIDASASPLSSHASDALICRPGHEPWVLAALLERTEDGLPAALAGQVETGPDVLQRSGVDPAAIDAAAARLTAASRPAAILAPQSGSFERWRAATTLAAGWCTSRGTPITVLATCANALGAARYMRQHHIPDWWSAVIAGEATGGETLITAGWDPTAACPRAVWQPLFARFGQVVHAGTVAPHHPDVYDVVLPLALTAEAGGTFVLADGEAVHVDGLRGAMRGALRLRDLFARLDERLDMSVPAQSAAGDAPSPSRSNGEPLTPPGLIAARSRPAVMVADPTQYGDGHETRRAAWSCQADLIPELRMSGADARLLGLRDNQAAIVRNPHGEARVRIAVAPRQPSGGGCYAEPAIDTEQPAGWMAITAAAPEIRALSGARFGAFDEAAIAGVIHLDIAPTGAAQPEGEGAHVAGHA